MDLHILSMESLIPTDYDREQVVEEISSTDAAVVTDDFKVTGSARRVAYALLTNPSMYLMFAIPAVFASFLTTRRQTVQNLVDDMDTPAHTVTLDLPKYIHEQGVLWSVGHWLIFGLFALRYGTTGVSPGVTAVTVFGLPFVATAATLGFPFIATFSIQHSHYLIHAATQASKEHGYDTVTTGFTINIPALKRAAANAGIPYTHTVIDSTLKLRIQNALPLPN